VPVVVEAATRGDLSDLADVAARTFPLACPPSATAANVAEFISANLSLERFADYLDDPRRAVLVGRGEGRIIGYAMLIDGVVDDAAVRRAVPVLPAMELSKMYVLPDAHGVGAAAALMTAALDLASGRGNATVWLGVNQENRRAQKFYSKHGFLIAGTKTFQLGEGVENDYVMTRRL
jgi:ribosomal protein S18 acetylase RimI-like enzyme